MNVIAIGRMAKQAQAQAQDKEDKGEPDPGKVPIIVDKGVRDGKEVRRITMGPAGMLTAYSDELGNPGEAAVWSYAELREEHPYIEDDGAR